MFTRLDGFCLVKPTAEGISPAPLSDFHGRVCIAHEINLKTKSVLLQNPDGTALGSFDLDQIQLYFKCKDFSGLLVPHNYNSMQALQYVGRVFSLKKNIDRNMDLVKRGIIAVSLIKGEFCDDLYFK